MTNDETTPPAQVNRNLDLIWGAGAIGEVIGKNARSTFHMLQAGAIPATKVGKLWCADRNALRAFFRREAA